MSRFTNANRRFRFIKPRLCYYCIKENIRNKTSERQRYFLIRKYIKDYLTLAKVAIRLQGYDKINKLDSLFFAVKADNNIEKIIAFEAITKPLKVILDENAFEGFVYDKIFKYMKAELINYQDIKDEALAYKDIRNDIINNHTNYLTFTRNGLFGKYDFDPAIKSRATIVPVVIENNNYLMDEINDDEIIVKVKILDNIHYDDYKNLSKEEISDLVIRKVEEDKNE